MILYFSNSDSANSLAYSAETFPLSCNIGLSNKLMNLSICSEKLRKECNLLEMSVG